MKIIHTGDWHLGHRLYNYDRADEEGHFFGQLAATVREERPDALVVSGDIFHSGVPGNDVAKRFTERLLDVVAECPGMETVVIAGMVIHMLPARLKRRYRLCFASLPLPLMALAVVAIVFVLYQFVTADTQPFIYFQF